MLVEKSVLILLYFILFLLGVMAGILLEWWIMKKTQGFNPMRKLKENSMYFQSEANNHYLLLYEMGSKNGLQLYRIPGIDREKIPDAFFVLRKGTNNGEYEILPYELHSSGEFRVISHKSSIIVGRKERIDENI